MNPKHPRGLYTLFFTEMWERFSYYGMRALLVLFMTDAVRGGLGLTDRTATAIYGLYTAAAYLSCLPGGWVADRLLGAQRSVWYGGIVIAAGHFTLAIPRTETFYIGLVLVALGTGLLKPNISAIVGGIYPEGGARRDAGFTIFYMGINLGAAIGPLICGWFGERLNWHYGFGAAGVGMVLGLAQFRLTKTSLGDAGRAPAQLGRLSRKERVGLIVGCVAIVMAVGLGVTGVIQLNPVSMARSATALIVGAAVLYFSVVLVFGGLDGVERRRVAVIVILFLAAALFWAGFEQAGSSFNLFAERYTDRALGWLNQTIPASWFQSLGPVFIITLAPVMASLWMALSRRGLNPSLPVKFGLGLVLLGVGFLAMAAASRIVATGRQVWPTWLITTYFVHTIGELCLSPVGLSSVTKLAPRRFVGQMMGTWFLAASLGNMIAGRIAGQFSTDAVSEMPSQYFQIVILPAIAGLALIVFKNPIKRWMGGVE
jgi:POT family proton-dependent oligopeptide transporter